MKTGIRSEFVRKLERSEGSRFFRPLLYQLSYLGGRSILSVSLGISRAIGRSLERLHEQWSSGLFTARTNGSIRLCSSSTRLFVWVVACIDRDHCSNRASSGQWFRRPFLLAETDPNEIFANSLRRARGIESLGSGEQMLQAESSALFGEWIDSEARRLELPVIPSRPWNTLVDRTEAAVSG